MIATLNTASNPQLRTTTTVLLPGRTLAAIQVKSDLKPEQTGQIYEVKPNAVLSETYPNVYIVPMIHNVDMYVTDNVPIILINFLIDDFLFSKGEIMGLLQSQPIDISEIMTETCTERSPIVIEEDKITEVLQEQKEKKFITSPADIDIH